MMTAQQDELDSPRPAEPQGATMWIGGLIPIPLFTDLVKVIGRHYPHALMRNGTDGSYEFILVSKEAS